ncbi:MAG: DUF4290 domain-containing protein [Chitinophagaceae bacterium]|jgi:hypothetical protein|nr:MAG: DUF4290 domain-containing protein [Chitinophagaceae bacterium]
MEYNTDRNNLVIREYGRNVQKMIEYLISIEDKEKRQRNTEVVIELMGMLNPHLRNVEDFRHKLWDHLFLIADFKLDVQSPYPIPTRETLHRKPERLPYPKKYPKYRHFGKNLEMVIEKAVKENDGATREGLTQYIGNYMRLAYTNWHKETVHDDMITSELSEITAGKLRYENDHSIPAFSDNFRPNKKKNHSFKNGKNSNGKNNKHKFKNWNN